jgi:hypothetical protein
MMIQRLRPIRLTIVALHVSLVEPVQDPVTTPTQAHAFSTPPDHARMVRYTLDPLRMSLMVARIQDFPL